MDREAQAARGPAPSPRFSPSVLVAGAFGAQGNRLALPAPILSCGPAAIAIRGCVFALVTVRGGDKGGQRSGVHGSGLPGGLVRCCRDDLPRPTRHPLHHH